MKDALYFDGLERLTDILYETVCGICGTSSKTTSRTGGRFMGSSDARIGTERLNTAEDTAIKLLGASAVDFLTPLGRRDISHCVLAVCRAIRIACDIDTCAFRKCAGDGLAESCINLAEAARSYAGLLRGLRKSGKMPSTAAYLAAAKIKKRPGQPVVGLEGGRGMITLNGISGEGRIYELMKAVMLHDSLCRVCEAFIGCAYNNI